MTRRALLLSPALLPAQSRVRIVLVGDSTVTDSAGWGAGFRAAFSSRVETLNHSRGGRSSKSFRDEGRWQPALDAKPRYVPIQFGHNDNPGKGPQRETDPDTTFAANLVRYVHEARQAGAIPVIVTSIVRRRFDADGKFRPDLLAAYSEAARRVARATGAPLLDLYELTRAQAERLGPEGCAAIDARSADGKRDITHLGPEGARIVGAMAAREFVKLAPELAGDLIAKD